MKVSDRFNFESKQKMKKMIELSLKEGIEYFTIIKKDYTLGKITKGERDFCDPKKLIESNKKNVIGLFHTHPHDKNFFDHSEYNDESFNLIAGIMDIPEDEKDDIRKQCEENIVKVSAYMSQCDLRSSIAHNLLIECIGTTDRDGKPITLCFELYSNVKERIIEKAKTLDHTEMKLFYQIYKSWINDEEIKNQIDEILEAYVLIRLYGWVIKEKSEIKFD